MNLTEEEIRREKNVKRYSTSKESKQISPFFFEFMGGHHGKEIFRQNTTINF